MVRDNKRSHIIETALRLFAEKGYDRSSIALIAKEAGVAQGLMYNYFNSKDELLLAIFQQGFMEIQATLAPVLQAGFQMQAYLDVVFNTISEQRSFWRLVYALRMQPQILQLLDKEVQDMEAFILATLTAYFSSFGLQNPEAEARVFFGMIDGVSIHYALQGESYPIEAVKQSILKRYQIQQTI
jgi:AcrR family transcriptional regulator